MAYYDQYFSDYPQIQTPFISNAQSTQQIVRKRMVMILSTVLLLVVPLLVSLRPNVDAASSAAAMQAAISGDAQSAAGEAAQEEAIVAAPVAPGSVISPVFTAEVRHWEPQILNWANSYGLDPNLVAIIMQIESCGDPQAVSIAGAQGLFQVMPFHFAAGENSLDPDTNAHRGMNYFVERLAQTGGDIGRAFAGYNGGHVAAAASWDDWAHETQRYYVWSTGIYSDIQAGHTQSETVQKWLQAGGASLCRQAAARLGIQ